MQAHSVIPIISLLVVLALAPWLVSNCAPRPLVPEELRQERVHYEQTANAIRTLTMVAQRQEESTRSIIVLGTVPPTSATHTPTVRPSVTNVPTGTEIVRSEIVIRTVTPSLTQKDPTAVTVQTQITTSPTARLSPTSVTPAILPTQQLQTVVDTITEEILTAQLRKEFGTSNLSDMSISLKQDGITGFAYVTIIPGLRQQIQSKGILLVKNASLVASITSITLDGKDVTEQYRTALEDRVNWGLYQLLPQRFVQSLEYRDGSIKVISNVRSP